MRERGKGRSESTQGVASRCGQSCTRGPTSRRLLTFCGGWHALPRQGHRASTRCPASLLAAAPAVFVRQPVAQPCALRIAAALHRHLVTRAPAVLAGRRGGVWGLALGSGLVLAGGRLGGQGLLHRLLDQGLQVGRRAHRWDMGVAVARRPALLLPRRAAGGACRAGLAAPGPGLRSPAPRAPGAARGWSARHRSHRSWCTSVRILLYVVARNNWLVPP